MKKDKFTPENEIWVVEYLHGCPQIQTKNGSFVADGWSPRIELAAQAPDLLRENQELKILIEEAQLVICDRCTRFDKACISCRWNDSKLKKSSNKP